MSPSVLNIPAARKIQNSPIYFLQNRLRSFNIWFDMRPFFLPYWIRRKGSSSSCQKIFPRIPTPDIPFSFFSMDIIFIGQVYGGKSTLQKKQKRLLCEVKEEEYHWVFHEDIAVIAYAMMDSKNRTYRDLEILGGTVSGTLSIWRSFQRRLYPEGDCPINCFP